MRRGAPTDRSTAERLLGRVRDLVDPVLDGYLADRRAEAAAVDPQGARLVDEIHRLIVAGGKRLRPAFCLLGHRAAGGDAEAEPILRAAAAIELLHTFALIHDDVMDDAPTRRGIPSVHEHLAAEHGGSGAGAFGRAAAVVAGDLAAVLAEALFLDSGFGPGLVHPAARRLDRMRTEMAIGQFLELQASAAGEERGPGPGGRAQGGGPVDEARARRIAALKTGAYTVEGPLHVGALLAGAPIEVLAALSRFGAPLGEAFQLRDDLLGILGADEDGSGEADLARGRPTFVLATARRMLSGSDPAAPWSEDLGGGVDAVRERLVSSGAVDRTIEVVNQLVEAAVAGLDPGVIDREAADQLAAVARAIALPATGA
jgi:geranylgeranyl diphosphate synthase type I